MRKTRPQKECDLFYNKIRNLQSRLRRRIECAKMTLKQKVEIKRFDELCRRLSNKIEPACRQRIIQKVLAASETLPASTTLSYWPQTRPQSLHTAHAAPHSLHRGKLTGLAAVDSNATQSAQPPRDLSLSPQPSPPQEREHHGGSKSEFEAKQKAGDDKEFFC